MLAAALLRALFLLPVLTFLAVSGTMNVLFSQTLGSNDLERYCWSAVGLAAAGFGALGFDAMRHSWKRGSPAKAAAALLLWAPSMGYDAMSAWGFMNREHSVAIQRQADAARPRAEAEAAVRRARDDLQPYLVAPELGAAQETVTALEQQTNDARCRLPRLSDRERDDCSALTAARVALTHAKAKERLTRALVSAEGARDKTKPPPPTDARFDTFGSIALWLPLVVLQLGSLLGIFAAAIPRAPTVEPEPKSESTPKPAAPLVRPPALPTVPGRIVPQSKPPMPKAPASGAPTPALDLVRSIARGERACPAGVSIDAQGWVRGPQRKLAAAAGVSLSKLNQELKAAARSGVLVLDTSDGTAVRLPS